MKIRALGQIESGKRKVGAGPLLTYSVVWSSWNLPIRSNACRVYFHVNFMPPAEDMPIWAMYTTVLKAHRIWSVWNAVWGAYLYLFIYSTQVSIYITYKYISTIFILLMPWCIIFDTHLQNFFIELLNIFDIATQNRYNL